MTARSNITSPPPASNAAAAGKPAVAPRTKLLLEGPIFPTLLRLSAPNILNLVAFVAVVTFDGFFLGRIGTDALAGASLAFPWIMIILQTTNSGMGAGVSSAVARALGAGKRERADELTFHAFLLALALAGIFSTVMLLAAPFIFGCMGGRDKMLIDALSYANVVFGGAVSITVLNLLGNAVRGTGNMSLHAGVLVGCVIAHIALAPALMFGFGPFPALGPAGAGWGLVIPFGVGSLIMIFYLRSSRSIVRLNFRGQVPQWALFADILKVGALASVGPVQTVLTVFILTRLAAQFGTEALAGYGLGARLEFLLIPVAFGIGVACVPMVGMALGAGAVSRARRVAWTGGLLAAAVLGVVGCTVALFPGLWTRLFTGEPGVLEAGALYFAFAGPCYALFGLGLCLYFASQGAGKVLGPVLAGTSRLIIVLIGGYWFEQARAPVWALFALLAFAMAVYGLATAFAVYVSRWGPAVSAQAPRR